VHGDHARLSGSAEKDLGWYDTGIGHLLVDVIMLLYPEQRAKQGDISPLEATNLPNTATPARHDYEVPNENPTIKNRPWLMKDPNHAASFPELLAPAFLDTKFIFTWCWKLEEIVPSMATLFLCFTSVHHRLVHHSARGTTRKEWGIERPFGE
jgi:hypothetical protein